MQLDRKFPTMADLAKLVVEVDAKQVAAAQQILDKFNKTANETDRSAQNISRASQTMSRSVSQVTNSFGLAGYQLRNLHHQFTDLAVQIGSGQGLFRPLLQQGPQIVDALGGPRGVSNVIEVIKTKIAAIPLAVRAAGAGLGIVGAAVAAGAALASMREEIER